MANFHLELQRQTFDVADRSIVLDTPANPDQVLEQAAASDCSVPDPYWGIVWPASVRMATALLKYHQSDKPESALELGCGTGLTGIAALMCGHAVTFSDVSADAVSLAVNNAELNGFEHAEGLVLDWRYPRGRQFDLIFGSDILYEPDCHQPLLAVLATMLAEDGEAWIGDMGRGTALQFIDNLCDTDWHVQIFDEHNQQLRHSYAQRFQMLCLSRRRTAGRKL